jgi:hypothetical protein
MLLSSTKSSTSVALGHVLASTKRQVLASTSGSRDLEIARNRCTEATDMGQRGDAIARARGRLEALLRLPGAGVRRVTSRIPGALTGTDAADAAAFEEAARKAYREGMTIETPRPDGSVPGTRSPVPGVARSRGIAAALGPAAPPRSLASVAARPADMEGAAGEAAEFGAAEPAAVEYPTSEPGAEVRPTVRRRRQPGDTAPDFLLRTPTSVDPIADDFFDGLIRRVEGDR